MSNLKNVAYNVESNCKHLIKQHIDKVKAEISTSLEYHLHEIREVEKKSNKIKTKFEDFKVTTDDNIEQLRKSVEIINIQIQEQFEKLAKTDIVHESVKKELEHKLLALTKEMRERVMSIRLSQPTTKRKNSPPPKLFSKTTKQKITIDVKKTTLIDESNNQGRNNIDKVNSIEELNFVEHKKAIDLDDKTRSLDEDIESTEKVRTLESRQSSTFQVKDEDEVKDLITFKKENGVKSKLKKVRKESIGFAENFDKKEKTKNNNVKYRVINGDFLEREAKASIVSSVQTSFSKTWVDFFNSNKGTPKNLLMKPGLEFKIKHF